MQGRAARTRLLAENLGHLDSSAFGNYGGQSAWLVAKGAGACRASVKYADPFGVASMVDDVNGVDQVSAAVQCRPASATASVPCMPAINEGATHDRNMSRSRLLDRACTTARWELQLAKC